MFCNAGQFDLIRAEIEGNNVTVAVNHDEDEEAIICFQKLAQNSHWVLVSTSSIWPHT